jgi:hypothetical protein
MAKKAKGTMTVSLSELSQEIDLKEYLGRKPTAEEKRFFADLAIDTIENRSLDGKNINGKKFKQYTPEYAEFKGVTRDSVDMFLEGDMLDSMKRKKKRENESTVFIHLDNDLETKKGYNHMTRKSKANPLPKREFFGLNDNEAREIAKEINKSKKKDNSTSLAELRASLDLLDIEQVE